MMNMSKHQNFKTDMSLVLRLKFHIPGSSLITFAIETHHGVLSIENTMLVRSQKKSSSYTDNYSENKCNYTTSTDHQLNA